MNHPVLDCVVFFLGEPDIKIQWAQVLELLLLVIGIRYHLLGKYRAKRVLRELERNRIWDESTQKREKGVDYQKIDPTQALRDFDMRNQAYTRK